jgi:hypothetical protein
LRREDATVVLVEAVEDLGDVVDGEIPTGATGPETVVAPVPGYLYEKA